MPAFSPDYLVHLAAIATLVCYMFRDQIKLRIFAAIGEELGLLGGTAILIAYLLIVGSGLKIATQSDHAFDKLLAAGLTALIGMQAFVILAGVIRLLPLTGVVLPFVSYGGSALVANYVLLALLLRISDGNSRARRAAAVA